MLQKDAIELILISIVVNGQQVLKMKFYRNGETYRVGAGGLPELQVSGMSVFDSGLFFNELLEKTPELLLGQPVNYEESISNDEVEYIVAFFAGSDNGEHGENAHWTQSTGVRFKVDSMTQFWDPLLGKIDELAIEAAQLTNDWYFDIMVAARYKAFSSALPAETLISEPKTQEEIDEQFELYVQQMLSSQRKWSLLRCADNKVYRQESVDYRGLITEGENSFRIDFEPVIES